MKAQLPRGWGEQDGALGGHALPKTNRDHGRVRLREATRKGNRGAYICFCETNPPISGAKTRFIYQDSNGLRRKNSDKNGGFVLENEPTGRGF